MRCLGFACERESNTKSIMIFIIHCYNSFTLNQSSSSLSQHQWLIFLEHETTVLHFDQERRLRPGSNVVNKENGYHSCINQSIDGVLPTTSWRQLEGSVLEAPSWSRPLTACMRGTHTWAVLHRVSPQGKECDVEANGGLTHCRLHQHHCTDRCDFSPPATWGGHHQHPFHGIVIFWSFGTIKSKSRTVPSVSTTPTPWLMPTPSATTRKQRKSCSCTLLSPP